MKQATTIPYCEECRTSFAVYCRHAASKVVWVIDAPEED